MALFFFLFIFGLGLSIGSFLNVLIYRLPRSIPLTGRSFCPRCKKKISWQDNFPLLSFIFLRGKCRHCHSPISWQYPVVEFLTAFLFFLTAFWVFKQNPDLTLLTPQYYLILGYYLFLFSALVVIFFTDLFQQIIPDQVVYPAMVISLIGGFFLDGIQRYNLLSALGGGLFFLFLHLITKKKGMGSGDIKLVVLMGLILGFPKIVLASYLAFLTGALVGVILILAKKKKFGEHIPFGPFLAGSTIIALFWGEELIKWLTARLF